MALKNGEMSMDAIINDTINDYTPGVPRKFVSMSDATSMRKDGDSGLIIPNHVLAEKVAKQQEALVDNKEQEALKMINYNQELHKLDSKYTSLKFINGNILVRCEIITPTKIKVGHVEMWDFPKVTVHVPNKSGYGTQEIEHPFPFKTKAVIVNKDPEVSSVNVGDFVQLKNECIDMVGKPGSPVPVITRMFAHYDDVMELDEPGKSGYGYLLINVREIVCKL